MKINNESINLFLPVSKMSDTVLTNYALLPVFQRFGIPLGFGEKTVNEVCEKHGADVNLFLLVCNVCTFDQYLPNADALAKLNVENLITYLVKSHHYYRSEKLPEIERELQDMQQYCTGNQFQIIHSFFAEYKNEVLKHFGYEEESLFPYFRKLMMGDVAHRFKFDQYGDNHIEMEDKLSDLKNILIKYLPQSEPSKERNSLLLSIFLLEDDLDKHSLMEEKILIPFVNAIQV